MPARWRTKSGCLTCRMRRKKCDEEGSVCRACRRNGLTCIWQSGVESGKDRKGSDGKALVKSPPKTPSLSPRFSALENTPRDSLFQYFAGSILPQLMMPGSPATGATDMLKLGVQFPCVRDSFLACAALFRSSSEQPPPRDALGYYSGALCATRKMIQQSAVHGTEDWFYIQTLSLCIFERAQSGPTCGAMSHVLGASRVMALKVRDTSGTPHDSSLITPLQRMCAAALLYHAATMAFLSPDIGWLPGDATWEQVQQYFEPESDSLFAMPPSLCRQILEISRLARRTPLSENDRLVASDLQKQLNVWLQPLVHVVPGHNVTANDISDIRKAAVLYAMAADILLLKVTQPRIKAADSRVQARVKQIMSILQSDVHGIFWNQHYLWPFAIVSCAVQRETEMLFLLGRLDIMWERSHWGDIKRTRELLLNMLHSRRENAQFASLRDNRSGNVPEPFDYLLQPEGLSNFAS
ncbi:hypothetical protein P168DRAFT_56864 [Aspergillus campestris IBT 28561]|uniref:Zn(2)-C6 fungal-type domain-containing protein n=1 Tax=Aspergillus campestris (strain IBT 28561) TaxID=1392248 RepID=A0A2I1CW47_ASPC2|nr:uncharacterized protein P168DRAFT_56864 [Aspergillus campestris IBT 28561]PKY01825.1 hypothetical protein P168DRAFT_56864 [Aspergillus campestris IBT 28561]